MCDVPLFAKSDLELHGKNKCGNPEWRVRGRTCSGSGSPRSVGKSVGELFVILGAHNREQLVLVADFGMGSISEE